MWRKQKPCTLSDGVVTVENSMEAPLNTKNRTTMWSSNSTPRYMPRKNENTNSKGYKHPNVHLSAIYNSQYM